MLFSSYRIQDAAKILQIGFQDPATTMMEGIIDFHNHVYYFLIIVVTCVFWLFIKIVTSNYYSNSKNILFSSISGGWVSVSPQRFAHSVVLEVVWTVLPAIILIAIAVPSFALLYSLDEAIDPFLTLKVCGAQWYWSYEYSDWFASEDEDSGLSFDSYMLPVDELKSGQLRLLEVDNRLVLPVNTHIRVLVTSQDVLHSWAVPAFGIKVDACPGRLNQASLFIKRTGTFYGQCSEICGRQHGFMPIVVEGVSLADYGRWLGEKLSSDE